LDDQKLNDEEEPSEELTKRIKNREQTIKEVGDSVTLYPLMDQLKIRRKISRNKYRDYIQQIDGEAMAADLQPTAKLVPEEHRTVDIEYKNKEQLRSWAAIYKGRRAPSEHWKTSYPNDVNKPINDKFQTSDLEKLKNGDGIEFLKEFTAAGKTFPSGSFGIFLVATRNSKYRVKMIDEETNQEENRNFRILNKEDMVVKRARVYDRE
jgi:hypothetical protein